MDIRQATRAYESWVGQHLAVIEPDLKAKHRRMSEGPFVFLRGTFYRWVQLWPEVCRKLVDAPHVLAVGNLHVENFGTWRDVEGRLVWGVNDVDEACDLPYTQDLVRLATSATLAVATKRFALSRRAACDSILDGYCASLERGGSPLVLAESRRWLRRLALNELRDPLPFWSKLTDCSPARGRVPHAALRSLLPDPALRYRVVHRVAGVGSLGRPRFVALAEWRGALIAREAKAILPSATVWASGRGSRTVYSADLLRRAVRCPDPFFSVQADWIVRRLAPDCTRIELTDLPKKRDEEKLLRAMGWETANLHLATKRAKLLPDVRRRPTRWLEQAAAHMGDAVIQDWRAWTARH